jgi:hypothetical protein
MVESQAGDEWATPIYGGLPQRITPGSDRCHDFTACDARTGWRLCVPLGSARPEAGTGRGAVRRRLLGFGRGNLGVQPSAQETRPAGRRGARRPRAGGRLPELVNRCWGWVRARGCEPRTGCLRARPASPRSRVVPCGRRWLTGAGRTAGVGVGRRGCRNLAGDPGSRPESAVGRPCPVTLDEYSTPQPTTARHRGRS